MVEGPCAHLGLHETILTEDFDRHTYIEFFQIMHVGDSQVHLYNCNNVRKEN
jgi:hypothetical protein